MSILLEWRSIINNKVIDLYTPLVTLRGTNVPAFEQVVLPLRLAPPLACSFRLAYILVPIDTIWIIWILLVGSPFNSLFIYIKWILGFIGHCPIFFTAAPEIGGHSRQLQAVLLSQTLHRAKISTQLSYFCLHGAKASYLGLLWLHLPDAVLFFNIFILREK